MYNIIKNVLDSKCYELSDILKKIDTLWIQGIKGSTISDEEREELISLAQKNANVENSIDIFNKLAELDRRVTDIENKIKDNASNPDEEGNLPVTYPEFENGKWYYNGDKISFEGKNYNCIAPISVVCTWSPKDYPAYWEEAIE